MSTEQQIRERNRQEVSDTCEQKTMVNERSDEIHEPKVTNGEISFLGSLLEIENRSLTEKSVSDKRFLVLSIHFCNLLYATSYWISIGIFPYITKSVGVDMITYGYVQTTFGALQLLGGPVYGRLGDIFGSRAVLVLAHSCGLSSYFLLACAASPAMVFLSRVPGLLMHGAQGAQMVMTDLTSHKERAVALGQLAFSYGAGVVIGPFIGGQLSKYFSQQVAILFAAFLSSFAIVFVMLFVPKFTRKVGVGFIYIIKFVAGMPFGIFQSMFALVVVNVFKLTPAQHGMFMSYLGTLMMIVQGFGIGFITKRLNEKNTLVFSMALCTLAYFLWFVSYNAYHLCVLVVPLVFGGALFSVVINSILTKLVPPEDTGFALGLSFATQSLVRTLSPTIGGILLSRFGYTSFGVVGFTVCSTVATYLFVQENIRTEA